MDIHKKAEMETLNEISKTMIQYVESTVSPREPNLIEFGQFEQILQALESYKNTSSLEEEVINDSIEFSAMTKYIQDIAPGEQKTIPYHNIVRELIAIAHEAMSLGVAIGTSTMSDDGIIDENTLRSESKFLETRAQNIAVALRASEEDLRVIMARFCVIMIIIGRFQLD